MISIEVVIPCSTVDAVYPLLTQALEQKALLSFQFVQGCLVKVTAPGIGEQIANFPFSLGDTWISSLNDERSVYLCLHRRLLTAQQSAWLLAHQVTWSYL